MKFSTTIVKSVVCAGMLLAGSVASAGIIVTTGVDNAGTENVLAEACTGNVLGPALTVQGCLNTDHSFLIDFTSDENLEISGGQASIEAVDGNFSYLDISLAAVGWTFNKLLLDIEASDNGFITFTGLPGGTSSPFALSKNGSNKFIITGEDFLSVSFVTTVGVASIDLASSLKQTRIGGIDDGIIDNPAEVPEPSILMLMGLGLVGLGMGRKFKSAKAV